MPPALLFFIKITLAIRGLLWFHVNFKVVFSISVRNAFEVLIEIALNLKIVLGSRYILTIIKLPVHDNEISFHLFVSSSISFISVL